MKVLVVLLLMLLFVASSSSITDAKGQTPSDQATISIYSNTDWSGSIGSNLNSHSVDGTGNQIYNLDCRTDSSYVLVFSKHAGDGYLVVQIWEDNQLLNFGSTTSEYGTITITGACHDKTVSGLDTGVFSVSMDKPSYNYKDFIEISGYFLELPSANEKVSILFFDPAGTLIAQPTVDMGNLQYSAEVKISGDIWQKEGTYTMKAIYKDITITHGFQVIQPTPQQASTTPTIPNPNIQSQNTPTQTTSPNPTPIQTPTSPISTTLSLEPTSKIPHWVKSLFNLYAQGQVSDDDLISALKFLIQTGIIKVS